MHRFSALFFLMLLFCLPVASAETAPWQVLWESMDAEADQVPFPASYDLHAARFLFNGTHLRLQLEQGETADGSPRNSYQVLIRVPGYTHNWWCNTGAMLPSEWQEDVCTGGITDAQTGQAIGSYTGDMARTFAPTVTNITFPLSSAQLESGLPVEVAWIRSEAVVSTGIPTQTQLQIGVADSIDDLGRPFILALGGSVPAESESVAAQSPTQNASAIGGALVLVGLLILARHRRSA